MVVGSGGLDDISTIILSAISVTPHTYIGTAGSAISIQTIMVSLHQLFYFFLILRVTVRGMVDQSLSVMPLLGSMCWIAFLSMT